eukprot:TRINITY_DN8125_c0_g1_i1.p1 TRINITY_DN8125_c0_g1~~TRINITY_DN8125_c0_g1_i1.p1  ORF type:complete len:760 (+),score=144.57 TRINITY_DN8125_c0_g1_i1:73-2352(+)
MATPKDQSAESETTDSTSEDNCLLCYQELTSFALTSCNHSDMCCLCSHRLRKLYDDKRCPFCKAESTSIVYTSRRGAKFQEFDLKTGTYDRHNGIYYDDANVKATLDDMTVPRCQKCRATFPNINQLKSHLKTHDLRFCDICLKYKKVFLAEQIAYSSQEYIAHVKEGLNLQKPHPSCGFCNEYFYGDDELYTHMQQTHFTCHICERRGRLYQYYRDYNSLDEHFSADHFPCEESSCKEKKFVVFATEIDLKAHMIKEHEDRKMSRSEKQRIRKIDLGFQYAPPESATRRTENRPRRNQNQQSRGSQVGQHQVEIRERTTEAPSTSSPSGTSASVEIASDPVPPIVASLHAMGLSEFEHVEGFCPHGTLTMDEIRQRNHVLVQALKSKLPPGSNKYDDFRRASLQLKNGEMQPEQYLRFFLVTFGRQSMDLFLELINLMPNQETQVSLLRIYLAELKKRAEFPELGETEKKPDIPQSKWASVVSRTVHRGPQDPNMINCLRCGSEIHRADLSLHIAMHESIDLASTQQASSGISYSSVVSQAQSADSTQPTPRAAPVNVAPITQAKPASAKGKKGKASNSSTGTAAAPKDNQSSWATRVVAPAPSASLSARSSSSATSGNPPPGFETLAPSLQDELLDSRGANAVAFSHFRATESNVRLLSAAALAELSPHVRPSAPQEIPHATDFPALPAAPKPTASNSAARKKSKQPANQAANQAAERDVPRAWGVSAPQAISTPAAQSSESVTTVRKGKKTVLKFA